VKKIFIGLLMVKSLAFGGTLESYNNGMGEFNRGVDKYIMTPVGKGYRAVMPSAGEKGVNNFFSNIGEVRNVVNNGAQGEGKNSWINVKRFAINSTAGVFGLFDVATKAGIASETATFDKTLESYGVGGGNLCGGTCTWRDDNQADGRLCRGLCSRPYKSYRL